MKKSFLPILFAAALSFTPSIALSQEEEDIPVSVSDSGSTLALAAIGLAGLGVLARRIKRGK